MTPGGGTHGYAALGIVASLRACQDRTGTGVALGDNVGFLVNLPNRRSFCPDAAFWTGGPLTEKFLEGAPVFAVEVRSPEQYGPSAERESSPPSAPTTSPPGRWSSGTWTCAPAASTCIAPRARTRRTSIRREGEHADAEPAVPGWSMPVDDLFPGRCSVTV
jgi:hypothetical protein